VAEGRQGKELLSAVQRGLEKPREQQPRPVERENLPSELAPLVDLLKILLKMKCAEAEVAPKLVAGVADLERIAMGQKENVAAMAGWRKELFGTDAQKLRRGELALRVNGDRVEILEVENKEEAE
jgi:ribonuclease D